MSDLESVKKLSLPVIASLVTSIGVILGAVFTVDSRYAHADDVNVEKAAVAKIIQSQTNEIQAQTQLLRRSIIEDKIFELDAKRHPKTRALTTVEEAQYKRYERQLTEINNVLPRTRNLHEQSK